MSPIRAAQTVWVPFKKNSQDHLALIFDVSEEGLLL